MLEDEINQFNSILKQNSFKKAKFNKDKKKKKTKAMSVVFKTTKKYHTK
jgi:hypothetical protein